MITDYITGKKVPDVGAEANRQVLERFLVEKRGFNKQDIQVSTPIGLDIGGRVYRSHVDLVVTLEDRRLMAIKCAAGSLGSREREIVSAARLLDACQIPLSLVSDGKTAILLDTVTGRKTGEGMAAIPSRKELLKRFREVVLQPLAEIRREREKLIFKSYDSMNVNVIR